MELGLVFLAAGFARLPLWLDPTRAVNGWRQSDLASVARNFYAQGHGLFYPQIDWGGAGPGFVEMEFPLVPWAVGYLYRLTGGVHESLAGLLPAAAGILTALLTYLLARRLFGGLTALGAGLIVAVSPALAGASESLLSDPLMVAGSVAGIYAFLRWTDAAQGPARSQPMGWYLIAALSVALAILLKPTAALVGLPLAWLAWLRYGRTLWRQPSLWLFAVLTLAPSILWYWHAHVLGTTYGNTFGVMPGSGYSKFTHPDLLIAPAFYTRLAWRLTVYLLTPFGLLLTLVGLTRRPPRPAGWLVHVWLLACALYVAAIAEGNHQMIHYQLPLLPPLAILAGWGLEGVATWVRERTPNATLVRAIGVAALVVFASSVLAADYVYYARADPPALGRVMRERGHAVGQALEADGLMIYVTADFGNASLTGSASAAAMPRGHHMTPPDVFYFSGHRGWYLAIPWVTPEEIEALRRAGARYFVVSSYMGDEVDEFRRERPEIVGLLRAKYEQVIDRPDLLAFDLARPERSH
jgi:4-amino-4-deoxy-L-arabinose transferase-like glycosyltransferase